MEDRDRDRYTSLYKDFLRAKKPELARKLAIRAVRL